MSLMVPTDDSLIRDPIEWQQPFHWGILTAFVEDSEFELPPDFEEHTVSWGEACFTVLVAREDDSEAPEGWHDDILIPSEIVHIAVTFTPASDGDFVDYEGNILCESGRLAIGEAENERIIDVPTGELTVQVALYPHDDATALILRIF